MVQSHVILRHITLSPKQKAMLSKYYCVCMLLVWDQAHLVFFNVIWLYLALCCNSGKDGISLYVQVSLRCFARAMSLLASERKLHSMQQAG